MVTRGMVLDTRVVWPWPVKSSTSITWPGPILWTEPSPRPISPSPERVMM